MQADTEINKKPPKKTRNEKNARSVTLSHMAKNTKEDILASKLQLLVQNGKHLPLDTSSNKTTTFRFPAPSFRNILYLHVPENEGTSRSFKQIFLKGKLPSS